MTSTVSFELTQGLQKAFESIIMIPIGLGEGRTMLEGAKQTIPHEKFTPEEKEAVLDPFKNPGAWKSLWMKAGACATQEAQDENARRGIDSPGAIDGRLVVRKPPGEIKFVKKFDP